MVLYIESNLLFCLNIIICTKTIFRFGLFIKTCFFPSEAIHQRLLLLYNNLVIAWEITKLWYSKVLNNHKANTKNKINSVSACAIKNISWTCVISYSYSYCDTVQITHKLNSPSMSHTYNMKSTCVGHAHSRHKTRVEILRVCTRM